MIKLHSFPEKKKKQQQQKKYIFLSPRGWEDRKITIFAHRKLRHRPDGDVVSFVVCYLPS